jgi:hypothetical protein
MNRKRRFIPPLMFMAQVIALEQPMEPVGNEDAVRALYAKDKSIKDMESVNIDVMTPKEYGIMKLGKRNLKVARK